jgi:hypothetical protein
MPLLHVFTDGFTITDWSLTRKHLFRNTLWNIIYKVLYYCVLRSYSRKPSVKTCKRGMLFLCKLAWYQTQNWLEKRYNFSSSVNNVLFDIYFTYICTLFYLCQPQGGGRWWGFYLHMEYTLLCQLQSGGRWWFVLLTYGVHYSMSAPGLLRTLFYVSSRVIKDTLLCQLQGYYGHSSMSAPGWSWHRRVSLITLELT